MSCNPRYEPGFTGVQENQYFLKPQMSWLTFGSGGTIVDKGLVDEELDRLVLLQIQIKICIIMWQS